MLFNAAAKERLNEYVSGQESARNAETTEAPKKRREYKKDDYVEFLDEDGNIVYGVIAQEPNTDNGDIVWVDYYKTPERDGRPYRMNALERGAFDGMIVEPGESDSVDVADSTANKKEIEDNETDQPMPMVKVKGKMKPDWNNVSPVRAHAYLYNERGLSRENADAFVENNRKAAESELKKLRKKQPKMGTDLDEFEENVANWKRKVTEAQSQADYWQQVKDEQRRITAAEVRAREAVIQKQAAIEEEQRQEEELRKREEQAKIGSHNVSPQIREKWNAAPKVDGARNEITLANGERVAGRYVLVESGVATPSHNPKMEFARNDGFPVDENGNTVNDRDYERDKDAQSVTRQIAGDYDSRALQSPVVVSNDGVVLSGNGRTMAGELAAKNSTDGAYIEHLKKYGGQFGFTSEQVESMSHPRVLFVPDDTMPYTADTFAKFNQQEMKSQSKTEQAVKLGKIVDDGTFSRIIKTINGYDTLGDFYGDTTSATNAINELVKSGAISQAQYAEMFDGDTISSQGKEMLENMLIGKAFDGNPDAVREITSYKSVRQSIISALTEISNNMMLGDEYSLESELSQAIDLVYQARQAGYKAGERVSGYARQLNIFPFDEGESVADYRNATILMLSDVLNDNRVTRLKKVLAVYNHQAQDSAGGQMDLFTGDVKSKEDILNTVKTLLDNGTEEEQRSAVSAAVEQRKAASVQQDGVAGNVNTEGGIDGKKTLTDVINTLYTSGKEVASKLFSMKFFDVAETPKFMHGLGLSGDRFTIRYGVIARHFGKDKEHTFPQEIWEHLPKALLNPFAITKYYEDTNKQKQKGYRLYTTLQLANGSYVVVSATVKNAGRNIDVNAINTIFGRSALSDIHDELIYTSETITPEQQSLLNGNNPHQYTAERELSGNKGKQNSAPDQEKGEKNASLAIAESETALNPTSGQKEAGNYKKGHVKIDGFDISIENPKGSERNGTGADGKPWSVTMNNTYGYIRRTEGLDGDHIDVFLSDDLDNWNGTVYVVDQVNADGGFDEHKVMYGFNSEEEARAAYLSNYSDGWQGLGSITGVPKDEFRKWIDSSHRKTKAFADYKSVKAVDGKERDGEKLQKISQDSDTAALASSDVALRDALVGRLRDSGIEVVTDVDEGQRVLDEANSKVRARKRALETVSSLNEQGYQQTVISSADGAKVLKNLDKLSSEYEKSEKTKEKTFIGSVAKALGAKRHNSMSEYATFETKNGRIVTIRLADHNARVSNFDNREELDGISIVVSPKKNDGIINDGEAHVVEYYYDAIKLRRANGNPLADIVRSIQQALYSGEFTDTTGLGVRQEVNRDDVKVREQSDNVRYFRTSGGEAYGFVKGGKIYIDPRIAMSDTPIHEYAHLWAEALRHGNVEEWRRVVELMRGTSVWEKVKSDYPELVTDDEIADEVIAQYSGKRGAERLRKAQEEALSGDGDVMEKAAAVSAIERVKEALGRFWHDVADFLHIRYDSAEDVADRVLKDLLDGVNPNIEAGKSRQMSAVKGGENEKNVSSTSSLVSDEAESSDDLMRVGTGEQSDDDVSLANDPWQKMWGESFRTKKQKKAFAERERRNMSEHVKKLVERLHLDNVDIITDSSSLSGKRARAKGFYNKKTGKITIVLSNHSSIADIEQTLLHEAVAHYGLRQLFGKQFDTFLDNVYASADESIRRKIAEMAAKNGWDFRTATEEYLASLAEDTNFEDMNASWWRDIKRWFMDFLHDIGFSGYSDLGLELSDNELRYILWRSYENLAEPGRYRSILGEGADVAMQDKLKVDNYAESVDEGTKVAEEIVMRDVNELFNEELAGLTEENSDNVMLSLGRPSAVLRAAGVTDMPMKLYGNKVIKKMKKHGFKLDELRDLPRAVANPIAVFKNYGKEGNRSVLTELQTEHGNFLVTLSVGKGNDIDFNIVTSVFGKGKDNIVDWINNGFATYINKQKTLDYLHHSALKAVTSDNREEEKAPDNLRISAPIAEIQSNQELDSAAKVIENFENPSIFDEKNDDSDVLFRDGDFSERDRVTARDEYERMLSSGRYQFIEAVQDSMMGLKALYQSVLGKETHIEDVAGFENAYLYENRMSSTNAAEQSEYYVKYMKPLIDEVNNIIKQSGARRNSEIEEERRILTDYLIAKHGLERNEYMREQAKQNGEDTERDFAGLTALTGMDDWQSAEAEAQRMVNEYEAEYKTDSLWNAINDATKGTLYKMYLGGILSKEHYEEIRDMYKYYVPLRGWDETTSDEVYGYMTSKDGPLVGSIMKTAKGRNSKADDPIATIAMMADDGIRQSNRNIMKQHFLNFVLNNPSDVVSVNDLWLKYDDVTDEWVPVFPDINPNDSLEEVEHKVNQFEEDMKRLSEQNPDKYKRGDDAKQIPYKVVRGNLKEHQVLVKRNGRTYVLTINGNPRAAQALNGLTNPDVETGGVVGNFLKGAEYVNRQLSAFYTTRNPDFVAGNFLRDMLYSNCMTWVKESPRYAMRFHKNFGRFNPAVMRYLLGKWENGTLSDAGIESMFYQFMKNGGETGYTNVKDIEGHKKAVISELKKHGIGREAWGLLEEQFDLMNRAVENCARFAAFVTSREMGRGVDRSIWDAKEISVNFNKKGSGGKMLDAAGQTFAGKAGAYLGGSGRLLFLHDIGFSGYSGAGDISHLHFFYIRFFMS